MRLKETVWTAAGKDAVAKHIQLHAQCMLSKLPIALIIAATYDSALGNCHFQILKYPQLAP